MNRELPLLDPTRCSICAICVRVCPVDCLAMAGSTPVLVRPLDCTECALCVIVCPSNAVTMSPPELA
jgi:NAD-dependent dihydropyrimidine dehydrogenase PreA subunit